MSMPIRLTLGVVAAVIIGTGSGLLVATWLPAPRTEAHVFTRVNQADGWPAAPPPIVPAPGAAILAPVDGASVERSFEAAGTLGLPPNAGQYAWVAVEIENGPALVWPKAELQGARWRAVVNEGGNPPGGRFRLVVIQIEKPARDRILAWFEAGRRTGRYPGLYLDTDLAGAAVLARINLQLRR